MVAVPARELRLWIVSDTLPPGWVTQQYSCVEDPSEADVVLVLDQAGTPWGVHGATQRGSHPNTQLSPRGSHPLEAQLQIQLGFPRRNLLPIIDFSGAIVDAIWSGDDLVSDTLAHAMAIAASVAARLDELPDLSRLPDTYALTALAVAYSRQKPISACWDFAYPEAVSYPVLVGFEQPRGLLEELASMGLLARQRFDSMHYCPSCHGSRLNVREECDECRSSDLSSSELVHHYRCAYQARVSQFQQNQLLICPKCHKQLRHYGVDYDKPATVSVCNTCGEESSEPVVGFLCTDCGQHSNAERVDTREWWHYSITPEGIAVLRRGVLPHLSLEASIAQRPSGYSLRDFVVLLRFQQALATRYKRPLVILSINITNAEAIEADSGTSGLAQVFALVVETLSQSLRQSDAVTAYGDTIYIMLPETDDTYTDQLAERLTTRMQEVVAAEIELDVGTWIGAGAVTEVLTRVLR